MKERINSIDIVRGLIMIIMTLDHSRDFMHYPGHPPLNLETTNTILFFTRWVTHFCAPTFVFLGGVSAYLAGQSRTKKELSLFLLKRGLWLILSDLLIISLLFSFDLQYHMLILEVLWATGFGMIILALIVRTPMQIIGAIAILLFFGHDLLNYVQLPDQGVLKVLSTLFLSALGVFIPVSEGKAIVVLYAVLPWTSALLMGYVFGTLYKSGYDANKRKIILRYLGIIAIALFITLRMINHYGDPSHWSAQRSDLFTIFSFLNTTKQSPSLLFLLMTLGPILILLSFTEGKVGRLGNVLKVYGNVPYAYFIIHLTVLRFLNVILAIAMGLPIVSDGSPIVWQFKDFGIPLLGVYIIWTGVVLLLYYPSLWYGNYKRTHAHSWLTYL